MTMTRPFVDEARALVRMGFSVIPIGREKRPRIPGATKEERAWNPYRERYADDETLSDWFAQGLHEALGVVCGELSGRRYGGHLVVLDLERRVDHEVIRDRRDLDAETAVQQTPGGGAHTFVISRQPCRNLEIIDPKEPEDSEYHHVGDVKAEGGYVVTAPSLHPSGRRYAWVTPLPKLLIVDDARTFFQSLLAPLGYIIRDRVESNDLEVQRSRVAELLATECGEGQRHSTLVRIAGWCRNITGLSEAESLCQAWNIACCKPPLGVFEVSETVEDIYARYQPAPVAVLTGEVINAVPAGAVPADSAARPSWTILRGRQLRTMDLPPIEWMLNGSIPYGRYVVLSGESGLGKSWWALLLALCAGLRLDFLGQPTNPIRALYIDEENGVQEAQRRLRALADGLGIPEDEELPVDFLIDEGVGLGRAGDVQRLLEVIEAEDYTLIITDSLIRFFDGNENNSNEVKAFHAVVDHIRRVTGVTWVMLQHLNKAGKDGQHISAGDRIRGSGEFKAHSDVHIQLRGGDASGTVVVHVEKLRGGLRPPDLVYRLEGDTQLGEPVAFALLGSTAAAFGAVRGAAMDACNVLEMAGVLSVNELIGELARLGIPERTARRGLADARKSGAIVEDRKEGIKVFVRLRRETDE